MENIQKAAVWPPFSEVRSDIVTIERVERGGRMCAVVHSEEKVITDAQSALELLMDARELAETKNLVVPKSLISEDFFILSTGVAGEVLQKIINYGGRIAVYGDFSRYTSKPLKDFMYESNKGRNVYFAATEAEAIEAMTR